MTRFGYFLATEEHGPGELVRQARAAERAGFEALWISDHFHPWLDEQGQAPFVWPVIGAVSQATSLPIGTAVTCPLVRTHPAVIAQAAATTAVLTGGRFTLGVGTGEFLNEHIVDSRWPVADERMDMLEEAVELMRRLFTGRLVTHRGEHYRVDNARLYTLPDEPPPIFMSGLGGKAAKAGTGAAQKTGGSAARGAKAAKRTAQGTAQEAAQGAKGAARGTAHGVRKGAAQAGGQAAALPGRVAGLARLMTLGRLLRAVPVAAAGVAGVVVGRATARKR